MEYFRHKEIKTIEQLDEFINFLTANEVFRMSNNVRPSMTPDIQQIYTAYNQVTQSESIDHAINLSTAILNKAPNFVAARYNLALMLRQNGNLDEALQHYIIAARYNPTDPSLFIEIGVVFSRQGKKKEAIEAYLHVLKITSANEVSSGKLSVRWLAMLNIGVIYKELQDFQKSLEWLETALNWINKNNKSLLSESAWDSELVATYLEIGKLYSNFGDIENSEKVLLLGATIAEKTKSLNQDLRIDETDIWMSLGQIYLNTNRWKDAEHYFEKCLKRNPNEKIF